MSNLTRFTRTIPASGVVELQTGNFILFISASAAINLRADNGGHAEQMDGVTGGVLVRRVKSWENMQLYGAPGTSVEFFYGWSYTDKDETDVRLQIATISGVAAVRVAPAATVADTAPIVRATATQGVLFAANVLRQRIRVFVDANNPDTCFARVAGGANNIANLQPGSVYEFTGTYALDVRNDTGGNCTFYIFEEA